jgi:hypothetical protein
VAAPELTAVLRAVGLAGVEATEAAPTLEDVFVAANMGEPMPGGEALGEDVVPAGAIGGADPEGGVR